MDKLNVSRSILSISSPGTHLSPGSDESARNLTRETNNEVSGICAANPTRLSFFASLPLPDISGSLLEIDGVYRNHAEYVKGFVVMTNFHGTYLGDTILDPVFKKLDEHKAVVFFHPTTCHIKNSPSDTKKPLDQFPSPLMEFFFDSTRAFTNLVLNGTFQRFPNIRWIIPHCGGTSIPLVERIAKFSTMILGGYANAPRSEDMRVTSADIKKLMNSRMWFNLAGFPFPDMIHVYLRCAGPDRLLYGSDAPYTPNYAVEEMADVMDQELCKIFDKKIVAEIYAGNARKLLELS